jgi:hypothetical protein
VRARVCVCCFLTNGADINLANTLVKEFPCRPHWTKNTRDVLQRSVKNLDPGVSCPYCGACRPVVLILMVQHLKRFKAVRQKMDPKGIYRSVVGEILGMYT